MRGSRPIEGSNTQSSKNTSTTSLYHLFLSTSSPRSSSVLHDWRIDDDDALECLGQLEQPMPLHVPTGSLSGLWSFGSQETSSVCLTYRVPSEARPVDVSCLSRSSLEAQGPGADIL